MKFRMTLNHIEPVTHDTHHLVFDRPEGFEYSPGQGVELRLLKDGWEDEGRPFTPVTLPHEPTLEFVIKSYPDHHGVTEQIGVMKAGDEVEIKGPFGAISDQGPGVFIAGGAGITPMIAVLRKRLHDHGTLAGSTLVFANKTEADIIWRERFEAMKGLRTVFVVDEPGAGVPQQRLDRDYLRQFVEANRLCYLCGPPSMMDAARQALHDLGIKDDHIVEEKM
ncbi:FAD-binding oxidoreductase [Aurantimonas sp. C2-6-R+9]|uniref:FAD-binding oxidoreductase n=1 Tax=unclassified Aurantimonas TaxID=2638230 RepID=UPI002E16E1D3|nr:MULTISPECIES: FAD-binding oxidoreductase [unclassified Aurantimonas]MEC5293884.1 FAD-binding oxidoreductase [Aurantimonas sp. C2-3-R2]MEC5383893.1 FAD-binding oxidoreductase [Aurantimonas sp. C2-6-R+9]MEC5414941.1 FAD-binding oxidoreductase [Aurantimonas sp. C2-4-R8]